MALTEKVIIKIKIIKQKKMTEDLSNQLIITLVQTLILLMGYLGRKYLKEEPN